MGSHLALLGQTDQLCLPPLKQQPARRFCSISRARVTENNTFKSTNPNKATLWQFRVGHKAFKNTTQQVLRNRCQNLLWSYIRRSSGVARQTPRGIWLWNHMETVTEEKYIKMLYCFKTDYSLSFHGVQIWQPLSLCFPSRTLNIAFTRQMLKSYFSAITNPTATGIPSCFLFPRSTHCISCYLPLLIKISLNQFIIWQVL